MTPDTLIKWSEAVFIAALILAPVVIAGSIFARFVKDYWRE